MNDVINNMDTAALAAQVANNEVELVKAPSCKGVVIASAIGATTTVGGGIAAFIVGKKIGKKKAEEEFEDRLSAIEKFLMAKDYEVVDDDFEEDEEEPKKAEKKETEG